MKKVKTDKFDTPITTKSVISEAKKTPFVLPKWLPLTLILVATALLHLQYLDMPLERDESIYAYLGKLALNGGKPYYDFYEMKPPMMFYSYALFIALFGYSATGIHLSAAVLAVWNTLFTFLIARKIGGEQVDIVSALAYIVWSINPGVYGTYFLSENVALLWGLPALLLALNYPEKKDTKQLFFVGFLLSMSFLVKQTAGVLALSVGVYWLTDWFFNRKELPFLTFFKPILWSLIGFFTPIALMVIGLWAVGTGKDALFWLKEYPSMYANSVTDEASGNSFKLMLKLVFTDYKAYFCLSVLGILMTIVSRRRASEKFFLIVWVVSASLTVAIGRRYYGHYWLFALPVLAILGALFFQEIKNRWVLKMGRIEKGILVVLAFLWSIHAVFMQPSYYFNPPLTEISRQFSPGNPFVEHQVFANYIQKIIKPTDRLAVFGSDPQYFIYLQKISPIRHVYLPMIVNGELEQMSKFQDETIESFKQTQPEYVVFNNYPIAWMYRPNFSQRLFAQIYNHLTEYYDVVAYIEDPTRYSTVEIKESKGPRSMPSSQQYIVLMKRR
jgi:hypothetical protein